ncbi:MAG: trigger factor [Gemmatimonadetes bacterium]|nr:trigger factor [Gemmatimonadota bacterium]MBT8477338.1 trigger factor [Gemmatimonadota bacterium]
MAADISTAETPNRQLDVAVEVGDGWTRKLTITIPPERVGRARAAERKRLSKRVRIKGFRRGKIPADVIEQRYGDFLDEHVRSALVEEAYREAVDETELRPAGAAHITNVQYAPGERLTFQAEFEIMPSVTLNRLGGFKLQRETAPVTDEEVREILDRIRSEHADWNEVDRSPKDGERVSVAIEPLAAPDAEPTGEARPYQFVLGSGEALEDVEKAIKEIGPGEAGTFDITFAGEGDQVAAETRRLHIRLDTVEEQVLPELDDALAATAGDFENVAGLEEAIRSDLARHHEDESEARLRGEIMQAVTDANPFAVPHALVDRYLDEMIQAPEDADPDKVREARTELAPLAEARIKEQLVIDRIIDEQELQASEEEVREEIERLAEARGISTHEVRRQLAREGSFDAVGRNLAVDKVFEYLKTESSIE